MKTKIAKILIMIMAIFCITSLFACEEKITVTFSANGGVFEDGETEIKVEINKDSLIAEYKEPTREGYTLLGFSENENGDMLWNFETDKFAENITLYAVWSKNSAVVPPDDNEKPETPDNGNNNTNNDNTDGGNEPAECTHEETKVVQGKAATCTATGLTDGEVCKKCGVTVKKQNVIPVIAHTEVEDKAVAATCTKTGLSAGKHCSVCNTITIPQFETPKIAHTYDDKYDENCNACGYVRDAECAHTNTEVIPGKVATCTEAGLTDGEKCKKCGEIIMSQTSIDAKGHSWNDGAITIESTCTDTGVETFICTFCNTTRTESVNAKGHDYSTEWTIDIVATCTTEGSKSHHCTRCDTKIDITTITSTGHTWNNGVITSESTCIKNGIKTFTCSFCTATKNENISTKDHSFDKGKCVECSAIDPNWTPLVQMQLFMLEFGTKNSSGNYTLKKVIESNNKKVTVNILMNLDGKIEFRSGITQSGENNLNVLLSMEYDYLSETQDIWGSIVSISGNVMSGPNTINANIGGYFYKNTFSSNYRTLYDFTCSDSNIGFDAESLYEITVVLSLTIINEMIVEKDDGFSLSDLGYVHFNNHTEIVDSTVEPTCTENGKTVYICTKCGNIRNEIVSATGHTFSTKGNDEYHWRECIYGCDIPIEKVSHSCIYSYNCSECQVPLYSITEGLEYELSNSGAYYIVTGIGTATDKDIVVPYTHNDIPIYSIANNAFENCQQITSIVLPDSISNIGSRAFYGCTNLENIIIGRDISRIGNNAFYNSGAKSIEFRKNVSYSWTEKESGYVLNPDKGAMVYTVTTKEFTFNFDDPVKNAKALTGGNSIYLKDLSF